MTNKTITLELKWVNAVVDWWLQSFVMQNWYSLTVQDDEWETIDNPLTVIQFAETILINMLKRDMIARDVKVAKKTAEIQAKASSEASFEQLDISIKEE